jgi:hypothetical protein
MAATSFLTNLLFLLICLLLSVLQPSALYLSAGSFWIVVLGLLTGVYTAREQGRERNGGY